MMQKVVDAESTVTANITRINEFCELVHTLTRPPHDLTSTRLYNDFQNMVAANSDVMKGMHKLDEDLDELTNSLVFDHGSVRATHLAKMLNDQAMPAFNQLMKQGARIGALPHSPRFSDQVALSQQGSDNLDIARAIGNQTALTIRHQRTRRYVKRNCAVSAKL
ncbi:hypothetical protein L3X07_04620 [Levilactobacillus brevis]|nr:hypothetical protein [Levilactobacillus brevis]